MGGRLSLDSFERSQQVVIAALTGKWTFRRRTAFRNLSQERRCAAGTSESQRAVLLQNNNPREWVRHSGL